MLQGNTKIDWSKAIRAKIVPFGGMPTAKYAHTFRVGWHPLPLTFTEIMDAIRENIIKELVYFRKVARQHIPDLLHIQFIIQLGILRVSKSEELSGYSAY